MRRRVIRVVAAAIIGEKNGHPAVLLARRKDSAHQGGKWEFPGGKTELGEQAREALMRELKEELGVRMRDWSRLLRFPYSYPEFDMDFEVYRVTLWDGEPYGREGQEIRWLNLWELDEYDVPPPSIPVIRALQLPLRYAISADPSEDGMKDWLAELDETLARGAELIQLRAHTLSTEAFQDLAEEVIARTHEAGARVVLNCEPMRALQLCADGVHLTSNQLRQLSARPLPPELLVGASCHSEAELARAVELGLDFAVMSPVVGGKQALGWRGFASAIAEVPMPVYALGGLGEDDLELSIECGGQGVAGIRNLWGKAKQDD